MTKTIKVKRLPVDPGPAAWNSILTPASEYPRLNGDINADWVVVGGGFTGIAAARRLSQLVGTESIVLLEAKRLADGPAGRNSGFMIDLPHDLSSETYAGAHENDLRQIKLNREAIRFAGEMATEYGMPKAVFNPCGKVTAAGSSRGEQHIASYQKHLSSLGESFRLMDHSEMKEWTGCDFYRNGLFTPGAVMIQPAAFIRKAAEGLSAKISIYENSPVTRMELGAVHKLVTPGAIVRAKGVILAVNGHIQSFGFFPKRLLHVFTYASMTRALTPGETQRLGGASNWGILPADPMGTTVRRSSDFMGSGDRIVIRNHATLNQSIEATAQNMKRAARLQDRSFENRFPMLKGVEMEYRWGGRLCLSLNSVPAFGEVESRVWAAACQNGLGTVKGTLSGMMAAEQAVLGSSTLLTQFLDHQQPGKLPPEPFLTVGANMTMRWKEWQAGIEM
ncbi:NAD(P)/FAD-dependent oxidoreductase [Marinobacterium sedimentorum]|uniref:NAD(P)/FAD-dependent oxidoreductase n=1 Tax=Marinobacterium sedimentorum TaxID=2927804 RepID=UPI0020C6595B|nr:FAD-binding oxidoreductase [Marinobacterium sedimentorum]MCP8687625.1 FAD-binding oxidoreductase [Marinobacterium sedimentorum]